MASPLRYTPCAECGQPSYRYYRESRRHKKKTPYCTKHLRRMQRRGTTERARRPRLSPAEMQQAADLRLNNPEKWSWRALGKKFGVTHTWVRQIVLENFDLDAS